MDKNSKIGLALIALVVLVFSFLNRPSAEELKAQAEKEALIRKQDSIQAIADTKVENTLVDSNAVKSDATEELDSNLALVDTALNVEVAIASIDTIENDKIIVVLNSTSGTVSSVYLKEYNTYVHDVAKDSFPLVQMFDAAGSEMALSYESKDGTIRSTKSLGFKALSEPFKLEEEGEVKTFTYAWKQGNKSIQYSYALSYGSYDLKWQIDVKGFDGDMKENALFLNFKERALLTEKSRLNETRNATVFYKPVNDDRDYLSETGDEKIDAELDLNWVAFKTTYFSTIMIPEKSFAKEGSVLAVNAIEEDAYVKEMEAQLNLGLANTANGTTGLTFFFGPNDYDLLKSYDNDLETIINLGWGIIRYVNEFFVRYIFDFFIESGMSAALAILLLTIIIKSILFPLYWKNYISSAKMRVLKPEIEALSKKFPKKEDSMKKQQAQMQLYRETGVNPLSGCIPMLIQMPILFAMFRFFPSILSLRQKSFLWADDLGGYDAIVSWSTDWFGSSFYGNHVSLITLFMAASTLIYTRMSSNNMPQQEGMPNMQVIMYIFPFMMIFFFNNYPSGLALYYFIANMITIIQMWVVKKYIVDEDKIRAKMETKKAQPKKKSRFQQRLEELQKKQTGNK